MQKWKSAQELSLLLTIIKKNERKTVIARGKKKLSLSYFQAGIKNVILLFGSHFPLNSTEIKNQSYSCLFGN